MSTDKYIEQLANKLRELLKAGIDSFGKISKCLEPFLKENKKADWLALEARYGDMVQHSRNGTMSETNLGIIRNNLIASLSRVITNINDWVDPYRIEEVLAKAATPSKEEVDKLAYLRREALVGWDREEITKLFTTRFIKKKSWNNRFQHYFLISEYGHRPYWIVERLYYTVFNKGLEANDEVRFIINEEHKNEAVKGEPFPQGVSSKEDGKMLLKFNLGRAIFGKRFSQVREKLDQIKNLDGLFKEERHPIKFKYFIIVFELDAEEWEPHTTKLLNWMIRDFCKQSQIDDDTNFIFFYLITYKSERDRSKTSLNVLKRIKKCLSLVQDSEAEPAFGIRKKLEREVIDKNDTVATLLSEPSEASLKDIRKWVKKYFPYDPKFDFTIFAGVKPRLG